MMMMPKKKIATVILGALSKKEGPTEERVSNEGPSEDHSMAKESAAEAMMSALESKDPKAFAQALEDFLEICSYKPESTEAE